MTTKSISRISSVLGLAGRQGAETGLWPPPQKRALWDSQPTQVQGWLPRGRAIHLSKRNCARPLPTAPQRKLREGGAGGWGGTEAKYRFNCQTPSLRTTHLGTCFPVAPTSFQHPVGQLLPHPRDVESVAQSECHIVLNKSVDHPVCGRHPFRRWR